MPRPRREIPVNAYTGRMRAEVCGVTDAVRFTAFVEEVAAGFAGLDCRFDDAGIPVAAEARDLSIGHLALPLLLERTVRELRRARIVP